MENEISSQLKWSNDPAQHGQQVTCECGAKMLITLEEMEGFTVTGPQGGTTQWRNYHGTCENCGRRYKGKIDGPDIPNSDVKKPPEFPKAAEL
jgi:hypothetical protein